MKAFDFDRRIIDRYENFSRSFTKIRSPDLAEAIEAEYYDGRFWPDSLLSLNPRYKAGVNAARKVRRGDALFGAFEKCGIRPRKGHVCRHGTVE